MIILAELCIMKTKNHCLQALFDFICFSCQLYACLHKTVLYRGTRYQDLRTIYFKNSCKMMWNNSECMFNLTFRGHSKQFYIIMKLPLAYNKMWTRCVCVNPSKLEHFSYFYHIFTQYMVFSVFNVFNSSNIYWIDTFNRLVDCWWHGKNIFSHFWLSSIHIWNFLVGVGY